MILALCNQPRVASGHRDQIWTRPGAATSLFLYGRVTLCRRGSRPAILGRRSHRCSAQCPVPPEAHHPWLLRAGLALRHRRASSCHHRRPMHPQSIAHKAQCCHRRQTGLAVASAWAVAMLGIPHPCSSSVVREWFLEGLESCLAVVIAEPRCSSRHLAPALGATGPGSCNCSSARAAATTSMAQLAWATTAVVCSYTTSLEVETSDAEVAAGAAEETFQGCPAPTMVMAVTAAWQWMLHQCHL